jgi:hypothetical protein
MIDTKLREFATVRQLEYLEAIEQHGSERKAAKALGVSRGTVSNGVEKLKRRAAGQGYSPDHDMTRTVPDGFKLRGVSTLYDKDGKLAAQWVKASADDDRQAEILKEFAASLAEGVKGLAPITPAPLHTSDSLLSVYKMGDPHFGALAWAQEVGEDFDLAIAEKLTCGAIDRLVATAPASKVGLLLNLGDMFHADNQRNVTQSGHQLDVDGRWAKIQQVGLRAMLYCVKRLLEKHEKVIFRINRGNHDGHSSYALSLMVSCYFHNEPRVEVDLSPSVTWYLQFGKCLIASTHGDTLKEKDMLGVMAADKPKEWGDTRHRVWYVGHVHHKHIKEYPGGVIEYVRTLAARDSWHFGQGYRAGRDMELVVHHKEHGEVERHRCDVGMIA